MALLTKSLTEHKIWLMPKLWTTPLIVMANGASWLGWLLQMEGKPLEVKCSSTLSRKDNNNSLKDLLGHSQIFQFLTTLHTKTIFFVLWKRKLLKHQPNCMWWKLETQLQDSRNSKSQLSWLMLQKLLKISQFWCIQLPNLAYFSSLLRWDTFSFMRLAHALCFWDRESLTNLSSLNALTPRLMEWSVWTKQERFMQSMLMKTILFHTLSISADKSQTMLESLSSLLRDSHSQELITFSRLNSIS